MSRTVRRDQAEATRQRLLEAGVELLNHEPTQDTLAALTAQRIAQQAGVTTGAFYHHFDSQTQYANALISFCLSQERTPSVAAAELVVRSQMEAGAGFAEMVLASCRTQLAANDTDPTMPTQFLLGSRARNEPAARADLDRMYEKSDGEVAALFDEMRVSLGRQWRAPFDAQTMAACLTALSDGIWLRRSAQPDALSGDVFGLALLALVDLFSCEPNDERTAEQWVLARAPTWVPDRPNR